MEKETSSKHKSSNGVKADVIGSLPTNKIFELLESDKYGWNKIREVGAVQMEIYRDVMRATAEVLKGNDL